MKQEKLQQLKELLEEAKQSLPRATLFEIQKDESGNLILVGESMLVNNGSWDEWRLSPDGKIAHKNGLIY